MTKKYIKKDIYDKAKVIMNSKNMNGLKLKPKNDILYDVGKICEVVLLDKEVIDIVLKKKIENKIDIYLKEVSKLATSDDEDDSSNLKIAKDELARYKAVIKNKYRKYLGIDYYELLIKKIELLEHKINTKILSSKNYRSVRKIGRTR